MPGDDRQVQHEVQAMKKIAAVWACSMGLLCLAALAAAEDAPPSDLLFPNSDFEAGDLSNWTANGDAFEFQPTCGDNVKQRKSDWTALQQGRYWIGTYEKYQCKPDQRPGATQSDKPAGQLMSTGFVITQPYITGLVGGWPVKDVSVQLLVNGEPVYTEQGYSSETLRRFYWDVAKYKDQKAVIAIVDRSSVRYGHIDADDFRYVKALPDTLLFPNSDFEMGDLTNWTAEGEAFAHQPTKGDNIAVREKAAPSAGAKATTNVQGEFWIGTFEKFQGKDGETAGDTQKDDPQGSVRSIPFNVLGRAIQFRLGGGSDCEVRLLLNGIPVRTAKPKRAESMEPVLWEVQDLLGKTAEIEIIDHSSKPWGHINADDFRYARLD
jgi:hypothetical protein